MERQESDIYGRTDTSNSNYLELLYFITWEGTNEWFYLVLVDLKDTPVTNEEKCWQTVGSNNSAAGRKRSKEKAKTERGSSMLEN